MALVSQPAGADVFSQLRLVVNVLPGNLQNNQQINQLVDGVNAIFAACPGARITLTTAKITRLPALPAGFMPVGGANTVLAGGGNPTKAAVDAAANPEIGGVTGGYKVFLAAGLQNPGGAAINGASYIPSGHSLITQQVGLAGDSQTWAHEIAHGLGLSDLPDVAANLPNLMFPNRLNAAGNAAGTALTQAQCDTLMAEYRRRGAAFEVTTAQLSFIPEYNQGTSVLVTALPKTPGDGKPVTGFDWLSPHLLTTLFRGDRALDRVEITLDLRAALPRSGAVQARYDVLIDVDGNAATGKYIGASTGVDAVVAIELSGVWPFQPPDGARVGRLSRVTGDSAPVRLEPPEILPRPQFATLQSPPATPEEVGPVLRNDGIRVTVPLPALGTLGDTLRIGVEALTEGAVVSVPQQPIPTRVPRPRVGTPERRVQVGATVPLTGEGFRPGGTVTLFWGHNLSEPIGTAQVNTRGQFSTEIVIPRVAPGDYLLDVVDDGGGVGITVLTIPPESPAPRLGNLLVIALVFLLVAAVAFILLRRR
jgi:hypothetical protein